MRSWPALVVGFPAAADPTEAAAIPDRVSAELDGLDIVAIVEVTELSWHVFFRDEESRAGAELALRERLNDAGLLLTRMDVPDGDWARRSQAALGAVHVGAVTVAPPWDAAAAAGGAGTIVIEPAMGFGSGHHATTRLCLAALQRLDLHGKRVLDIGTGSGVLALAAVRLGAEKALGIDVDPDALDNARSNAVLNGSPADVAFAQADFREIALPQADVVMANLTGAMLAASVSHILRCCTRPGTLILSGITQEESAMVSEAFRPFTQQVWSAADDGWCACTLELGSDSISVSATSSDIESGNKCNGV